MIVAHPIENNMQLGLRSEPVIDGNRNQWNLQSPGAGPSGHDQAGGGGSEQRPKSDFLHYIIRSVVTLFSDATARILKRKRPCAESRDVQA